MDLNQILLLIAVLNLVANLFGIFQLRERLPRWIMRANLAALGLCGAAWVVWREQAGIISLIGLVLFVVAVRVHLRRVSPQRKLPRRATLTLAALTIAVFGVQVLQSATEDAMRLISIGALVSPFVFENGEWWRLISSQFIHFGALHLFCNMVGLLVMGPPVENMIGSARMAVSYLLSGSAGMALALLLHVWMHPDRVTMTVGASAGVFGLVGVQAALALRLFLRTGTVGARVQLSQLALIVGLQAVVDFLIPQMSSAAHLGGAACGFILGMIPWWTRTNAPTSSGIVTIRR
jgi:membrane associated rhomboid family serine protease